MWIQTMNEELESLSSRSISMSRMFEILKTKWRQFQIDHPKPDCILDEFLPLIETEFFDESIKMYLILLSNRKIQILYEPSFSFSRYIIFVLGTLEIVLNVPFNQGMLNLLLLFVNKSRLFRHDVN